jgi:hypothetical protein
MSGLRSHPQKLVGLAAIKRHQMTGRRRGYRAIGILVVGLALLGLWAANAQAALVGLARAGGATAFSSTNKSFTASCPAGKRLVGVGADIGHGGGAGQVVMRAITPNAALTAMTVSAVEDENGTTATWSLGGSALCAPPVPGLERIVAQSATNSTNKAVTATCPAGKRVLGAGGDIVGAPGQVEMDDIVPTAGLTSVRVFGIEDQNGASASWRVTAYAICANPVAGLQRVVATSATNSTDGKAATATCPAGKQVTGVGGDIVGGAGQVVMDDFIPFPNPATSVQVVGNERPPGTTANWSVTAYAICASTAVRMVAADVSRDSGFANATASCPSGTEVTGAGGEIDRARGEASMWAVGDFPDAETPPATTVDAASVWDEDGILNYFNGAGSWDQTAYAICATPLPGLERVFTSSASDSSDKFQAAGCPAGKRVVGAGGEVVNGYHTVGQGGFGEVVMDYIVPSPTDVTVGAFEDETGFDQAWSLRAYAICATPPPGLEVISASSALDSEEVKSATASCPSGKNLLGTGARIFGTGGQGQVMIDDLRPNAALTSVKVTGIEDQTGYSADWEAIAFAICANP